MGITADQRLAERIRAAEQRAETAQTQLTRLKVAHLKGLSTEDAARLHGDTEEGLVADADDLLAALGSLKAASEGRPTPRVGRGTRSPAQPGGGSFLTRAIRERP